MTDIQQLINDLENLDNEETREKAALDLAKIGSDSNEVIEALCKRAENDLCSEVREMAIYGLGQTRSEKAIPPLLDCLEEEDFEIRWVSAEALGEIASEEAIEPLIKRLDKEDVWNVRASIVKSLAKIGSDSEEVIQTLNKLVQKDESCFVKREAEFALSHLNVSTSIETKLHALVKKGWQIWKDLESQIQEIYTSHGEGFVFAYGDKQKISKEEEIKQLEDIIDKTKDKEARLQAALRLGEIDPVNDKSSIKQGRPLDLGISLKDNPLELTVAKLPSDNNKIEVWLEVRSSRPDKPLPSNLKLSVLSSSCELLGKIVESGDHDQIIQKRFSVNLGTELYVEITLPNQAPFSEKIYI